MHLKEFIPINLPNPYILSLCGGLKYEFLKSQIKYNSLGFEGFQSYIWFTFSRYIFYRMIDKETTEYVKF